MPLVLAALGGVIAASGVFSLIASGEDSGPGDAPKPATAMTMPAPAPMTAAFEAGECKDLEAEDAETRELPENAFCAVATCRAAEAPATGDEGEPEEPAQTEHPCPAPPPIAIAGRACAPGPMNEEARRKFEQSLPDDVKEALKNGDLPKPPMLMPAPAPAEK